MTQAIIEDIDQLKAFIAQQPLALWAAEKQRELDQGIVHKHGAAQKKAKDDNADLAAALSSMA